MIPIEIEFEWDNIALAFNDAKAQLKRAAIVSFAKYYAKH